MYIESIHKPHHNHIRIRRSYLNKYIKVFTRSWKKTKALLVAMAGVMNRLKNLDAYPKINDDFYSRTLSGGLITLASSLVMLILFFSELRKLLFFIQISVLWQYPWIKFESWLRTLSPSRYWVSAPCRHIKRREATHQC